MRDIIDRYNTHYQRALSTVRWHLYGSGLDNLHEETVKLPPLQQDQILVRHDACGICISDIKIINLGPAHPRLQGRNLQTNPVVMGHEVILTIIDVGDLWKDRFKPGERYIVQADIYYKGVNMSYGYILDGGMAQYGIVTKEALSGDGGCYLIPVSDDTGYAEAALVEPWACVVAAYEYPNYRNGIKDSGNALFVDVAGVGERSLYLERHCHRSGQFVTANGDADFALIRREYTGDRGFDDVIVTGSPNPDTLGRITATLGKNGIMLLIGDNKSAICPIDIGRIHYEQHLYIGVESPDHASEAYLINQRKDIKSGGSLWLIGAGGQMGQMHLQRAVMLDEPSGQIVVTDFNNDRLERIKERFGVLTKQRGIELILLNPSLGDDISQYAPFDDIVSMAPSAEVVEQSLPYLADNGIYNLFAGVAKGTLANIDIGRVVSRHQRIIGTSGSTIADLQHTLNLVQSGKLSTNASLAAIGGLDSFREGLVSVKEGRFPGKTVIFPMFPHLPLMSLDDLQAKMPSVYSKLKDGMFWTKDAEEQLFIEMMSE